VEIIIGIKIFIAVIGFATSVDIEDLEIKQDDKRYK